MRWKWMGYAALVLLACFPAGAQEHPDFSGTWKMDAARSETAHQAVPIGAVTLAIRQTPSEFRLETRRSATKSMPGSSEVLTFRLDGVESTESTLTNAPVKVKAHWDGARLVTETEREVNGSTVTTRQVFELSPGNNEMTIEKFLTVQHGYQSAGEARPTGHGRDVFIRTGAVK